MKKKRNATKVLWILLAAGAAGLALVIGISVGTGAIASREDAKSYEFDHSFDAVVLETVNADVQMVPAGEKAGANTFAKAWLEQPFEMDDVIAFEIEEGVLTVRETPFPPRFMAIFPQPYELKVTLFVPPEIIEENGGAS